MMRRSLLLLGLVLLALRVQAEPVKEIVIEPVGDELKFKVTEFTVAPGETVRLIFKNTAKVMPHNVVVLNTDSPSVVNRWARPPSRIRTTCRTIQPFWPIRRWPSPARPWR